MSPMRRRGAFERGGPATTDRAGAALFDDADATLLDLVDNILTKGVVIDAEVVLGLAGVDLVYLRVSALLVAVDKLRRVL